MRDRAKQGNWEKVSRILSATILISAFAILTGPIGGGSKAFAANSAQGQPAGEQITGKKPGLTADHTKFEVLQQEFKSGPEVTKACLSCHTEAAKQVQSSIHWTWDYDNSKTGAKLGKRRVINAFCGNVASNEPRCTSCHAGYGWKDMRKDPPSMPEAVDCLVCHAEKKFYRKFPPRRAIPFWKKPSSAANPSGSAINQGRAIGRSAPARKLRGLSLLRRWRRWGQTWRYRQLAQQSPTGA